MPKKKNRKYSTNLDSAEHNLSLLRSTETNHRVENSSLSSQSDFIFDRAAIIDNEIKTLLRGKMEFLAMNNNLIETNGSFLIQRISRELSSSALSKSTLDALVIFKMTSEAMMKASTDLVQFFTSQSGKLRSFMREEREMRISLQKESVELKLELMKTKNEFGLKCLELSDGENVNDSDLEDMFYDAASVIDFTPRRLDSARISRRLRQSTTNSTRSKQMESDAAQTLPHENHSEKASLTHDQNVPESLLTATLIAREKRSSRVGERPAASLNYLSFVKNCIGKDLSRITMPITFNEPLSALQRITEDLEYSSILDRAAELSDPLVQMAYVGIFAISGYSTTALRTTKPFNPLLGETYECDRIEDLGWKSVAEQVSHHPPASAMSATGKRWTFFQNYEISTKIRAKTLNVTPVGYTRITFDNTDATYTYSKVTTATTIANIMTGKMVTENAGEVTITNDSNSQKCILHFHESGYFSRDAPHRVTGEVVDESGTIRYRIEGIWDTEARLVDESTKVVETIWSCKGLPLTSQKMHCFTQFEIELNEPESGVAANRLKISPGPEENGEWGF